MADICVVAVIQLYDRIEIGRKKMRRNLQRPLFPFSHNRIRTGNKPTVMLLTIVLVTVPLTTNAYNIHISLLMVRISHCITHLTRIRLRYLDGRWGETVPEKGKRVKERSRE